MKQHKQNNNQLQIGFFNRLRQQAAKFKINRKLGSFIMDGTYFVSSHTHRSFYRSVTEHIRGYQ